MKPQPHHAIFICTGNSARSILGECLLNDLGGSRFRAFSAGSQPKEEPHPLALELLQKRGHSTAGLRSKSWHEFDDAAAPAMDFVFTVCDSAAAEACPHWPGQPLNIHWGIADPVAAEGDKRQRMIAFEVAYAQMRARVEALLALPVNALNAAQLKQQLHAIGQLEGATDRRTAS